MSSQRQMTSNLIDTDEDIDVINDLMCSREWTDGLPVVPPTEARVWKMIEASGLPADHLVAEVPPLNGDATVEKIAINAVMAGCLPEYMPVIIAATEAMGIIEGMNEDIFNLRGIQVTTNPAGVAVIVNGPIRKKLNINCGRNCLGPGWRANATIGRAVRLIQLNIGGGKPEVVDKALQGFPGKYTLCFGENEEESVWEPLHVERGFKREDSTVTVAGINSTLNIVTAMIPNEPKRIYDMLNFVTDAMNVIGTNNVLLGAGDLPIMFSPGHTRMAAEMGMNKAQAKKYLYENCGFPEDRVPKDLMRRERYERIVTNGVARAVQKPEDIMIVVAGGPEPYHIVYMPTFGDSWAVTRLIGKPGGG
ncbi:hypothetical protein ACFLU9_01915 [Chloroflexota bacterium]